MPAICRACHHEVEWRTLGFSAWGETVDVRVPVLSEAQSTALAQRVRDNALAYLKTLDVAEIVAILDKAIARLLDRDDPWRQKMPSGCCRSSPAMIAKWSGSG
jgi:siroheme synthase (precorrin-2 oxidase/ferrochelatase)